MKVREIEVSKIKVGDRIRNELGDVKSLAENIEEVGLLHPITVRKTGNGEYTLVTGERRLKACKGLGWKKIRATVFEEGEYGS